MHLSVFALTHLQFCALDALRLVDDEHVPVTVACADEWRSSRWVVLRFTAVKEQVALDIRLLLSEEGEACQVVYRTDLILLCTQLTNGPPLLPFSLTEGWCH
jgi:hypothetical protein